jgi:hypothetical protein
MLLILGIFAALIFRGCSSQGDDPAFGSVFNDFCRYPRAEPVALVPKHKLCLTPYGRVSIHPRAKPVELCPSGY